MNKWELAKYLIDAKKDIDSILYCSLYGAAARFIDLRQKISMRCADFYINCCVVIDHSFSSKDKKELCSNNSKIKNIYYQRDKNSAHKDSDYKETSYKSLLEMTDQMRSEIICVREICSNFLPSEITLDFVPHDRETFRMVNGLTEDKEKAILKQKQPNMHAESDCSGGLKFFVLEDISQLRGMSEGDKNKYCTLLDDGINLYEGLQNRQDWAIKTNCLCGTNIWVSLNPKMLQKMQKMHQLGVFDQFDIAHLDVLKDENIKKELDKLFKEDISNGKINIR